MTDQEIGLMAEMFIRSEKAAVETRVSGRVILLPEPLRKASGCCWRWNVFWLEFTLQTALARPE